MTELYSSKQFTIFSDKKNLLFKVLRTVNEQLEDDEYKKQTKILGTFIEE